MKINLQTIILLIIIAAIGYYHFATVHQIKQEIENKVKIEAALNDSLNIYKQKNGDLIYEKKTIQGKLTKELFKNFDLSVNQKELLEELKEKNEIIAAAKVASEIKVKNYTDSTSYKADSSTITFSRTSDSISYNILVVNAKQADTTHSTALLINNLIIPNLQTIDFSWGNKKEGYPVSFSISNSSPFISVGEMNSYIIPEITRPEVKPNFFQKLSKNSGSKIVLFTAGIITGVLIIK